MPQKVVPAGLGASIIGLIMGALLGTYGAWTPVFLLASPGLGRWALALTLGVFFAFFYEALAPSLPGKAGIQKGASFGFLVWVLSLILGAVFLFFREAVYASGTVLFLSAVVHIVWGTSLGYLYSEKI